MHKEYSQTTDRIKIPAIFVSDIHLNALMPETTACFLNFLKQQAATAEALYLLGDVFEYWAGDDDLNSDFNQLIISGFRHLSEAGTEIYFIAGNRDFLIGSEFSKAAGISILPDPSIVRLAGQTILLSHGDQLCTDDLKYMQFRAMVRQKQWQNDFLELPLIQRKNIIQGLRTESVQEQKHKNAMIMDVNPASTQAWFEQNQVTIMIHGHTHRPARHQHAFGERYVLPDWDCDQETLRGGYINLLPDGTLQMHALEI